MAGLIEMIVLLLSLLILARVLMSWVQVDRNSPMGEVIYNLTEPILAPARELLPPMAGMDFSPIIVLLAIQILGGILIGLLS